MALTAVCAKINAPIFSLKHPEVFQVAASLPVPQPSSLVGALAYCIGVERGIGLKAQDIVMENIIAARGKLLSEATVTNPIILRRFRILDKGLEVGGFERACEALRSGDFDSFRSVIEKELADAFYREYLSPAILKCIWILKDSVEDKALYLLQRLGDTESLISVVEAWSSECAVLSADDASTDYPFTLNSEVIDAIYGSYTTIKMCDERRELKLFYVPCKREARSTRAGVKYFVYIPTKVSVKLKKPHRVFAVDGEY
ncbi:MAG: type I-A CRISPR-associated protein Cas5a, partial [Candidatus Bathyarchaeota archaeon]|nr:type I-A CRISPR-associated protein Cas5a [Candidatus Bathyarchaeota archaeon]